MAKLRFCPFCGDQRERCECHVQPAVSAEDVKRAAAGIHRLFIMRDLDQPMPSYEDIARAAVNAFISTPNR